MATLLFIYACTIPFAAALILHLFVSKDFEGGISFEEMRRYSWRVNLEWFIRWIFISVFWLPALLAAIYLNCKERNH